MPRTIEVEVKSDKKLLTKINVEQFDSIAEAIAFLNGETEGKGEEEVLRMINVTFRTGKTNAERVRLTRGVSPMKALKERVKADPKAKSMLESLLAEFGIDASNL